VWIGISLIEENGFLQAVKVRGAIRASGEVLLDFPAFRRKEISVQLVLNMHCDVAAQGSMFVNSFHIVLGLISGGRPPQPP
jgi:hypothetical protein